MKYGLLFFTTLCVMLTACRQEEKESLTLWYDEPAGDWNEALPVGNGHAGAMVFGGAGRELLQLNENTLYSGEPSVAFKDVKVTPEDFERVVSLLREREYVKAYEIVGGQWLGRLHQYYQPFGDLHIESGAEGEISGYRRELDISEAIARTTFTQGGITYTREIFASNPDNIIVIRLASDKPAGIDVNIRFDCPHPTASQSAGNGRLILRGKAPGYAERRTFEQIEAWGDRHKHPELYDAGGNRKYDKRVLYGDEIDNRGMPFEAQLETVMPGKGEAEITGEGVHVHGTDEVYLVLALATGFSGYDKSPSLEGVDPSEKAGRILADALKYDYRTLKKRHTDDYRALFDRVSLHLPSADSQTNLPTDERIVRFSENPDPGLAALLYQFGRYLMISGSRPGGQPLNLQGMWNKDVIPPWNSGYTQNINAEMNYWPAETTNLSECHEPLFGLIRELAVTGRETARSMYGRRGWVAHHNTSIWRESMPNDNVPTASFWPMAQGWYCSHLWEHYLFTGDEAFLKDTAYPLMKGAAEFYADWLVDSGDGHLVTPAGLSPENAFLTDGGERAALSMGPTMDMAIIRETFTRTVQASEILDIDDALRAELREKLARLLPYRIGGRGQLQEWMYDFRETDPGHRHLSHLYGLHPGHQITPETPELFSAARTSLTLRGDEATGWSMGWKINCWARLQDGNHAYKIITNMLRPVGFGGDDKTGRGTMSGGGLYKSMLDAHPPFQIDGNFGYTAGVTEMLLQSHAGYIHLLPALPDAWPEGSVRGIKARGNFEVDISWSRGAIRGATIRSIAGKPCRIRTSVPVTVTGKGRKAVASEPVESNGKTYYETSFETGRNDLFTVTIPPE